jgi:hypothetical protein
MIKYSRRVRLLIRISKLKLWFAIVNQLTVKLDHYQVQSNH